MGPWKHTRHSNASTPPFTDTSPPSVNSTSVSVSRSLQTRTRTCHHEETPRSAGSKAWGTPSANGVHICGADSGRATFNARGFQHFHVAIDVPEGTTPIA